MEEGELVVNPLPFPSIENLNAELVWLPVVDTWEDQQSEIILHHQSVESQYALCLRSSNQVIEGFGHELQGYVLAPSNLIADPKPMVQRNPISSSSLNHDNSSSSSSSGNSSNSNFMIRYRPVKLRIIPKNIVEAERSRVNRMPGYRSTILDQNFGEITLSSSSSSSSSNPFGMLRSGISELNGYTLFVDGLHIAGIQATIQVVRIALESGKVLVVRSLFLESVNIRIELPDYSQYIHRVLQSLKYGEIREGLLLQLSSHRENNMNHCSDYYRPIIDSTTGRYPRDSHVAIKIIFQSGRFTLEDPMKEGMVIQYLRSAIEQDIHQQLLYRQQLSIDTQNIQTTENGTELNIPLLMREASNYIDNPIITCHDNSRQYIVSQMLTKELLFEAVGPNPTLPGNFSRVKRLFRQILLAVYAMHRCGVCHRDISLENILVRDPDPFTPIDEAILFSAEALREEEEEEKGLGVFPRIQLPEEYCVLVGFYTSQRIPWKIMDRNLTGENIEEENENENENEGLSDTLISTSRSPKITPVTTTNTITTVVMPYLIRNQSIGKLYYLPIENKSKTHEPIDGYACDIWALGIVLLVMATGRFPFDATDEQSTYNFYRTIRHDKLGELMIQPIGRRVSTITSEMRTELRQILPENMFDAIKLMLHPDRKERITAAQLLRHPFILYD